MIRVGERLETLAQSGSIFTNGLGLLYMADQRHLIADTYPHDDLRVKAFEYWTGSDGITLEDQEVLFEGIINIV